MAHPKRPAGLALGAAIIVIIALGGGAAAASLPSTPASDHAAPAAVDAAAGATEHAQGALDDQGSGPSGDEEVQGTDPSGQDPAANDHGNAVSEAAQSDQVGGPHQNHGGYVSCVARGGTDCTSTSPVIPHHGQAPQTGSSTKH
jgi:hypothetical protein